jgi:hypothetical protein
MTNSELQNSTRADSRKLALGLIGMKVTEAFYDENQLVLEFNKILRLEFSPDGLFIHKRNDLPEDQFPEEFRSIK